tara:strand:- start:959 stop:2116 length:1158 start_codon:yes stop_codon:yes gene_type:complete
MPIEQFLEQYWQKQPLLIRNAFAAFEPPLSADELAGLACEDEVESRLLIENPVNGDWELQHGPFTEDKFAQLPSDHWTLLVQAVDHWVPEAADFLEQFKFIPNWRLDDLMISYATRGGGVGPHFDSYDVFLIQAEGQRRWEIGALCSQEDQLVANKPVRILKNWQPQQAWVLNPGDMLYLPPRFSHNGVALSDDCITYSVGYRAPQTGEMLMQFASFCSQQLTEDAHYADPDLRPRNSSGQIENQDLERLRNLMSSMLDDPQQLRDWFGQLVTESKYADPNNTQEQASLTKYTEQEVQQLLEELADSSSIRRNEGIRFAYHQAPDSLSLYVDGQTYPCATDLQPLVSLLCDSNQYPARCVVDWFEHTEGRQLLTGLFNQDHLYAL